MTSSASKDWVISPIEVYRSPLETHGMVTLIDCNDSFTHNIVQAFLELGSDLTVLRAHSVSLDVLNDHVGDYLVISPGPGTPENAGIALDAYRTYMSKLPVLGVCLGMQAINEVMGGKTIQAPIPVHGKVSKIQHDDKGIFTGVSQNTPVARYHSLMVDIKSSQIKVQSSADGVVMAFRIADHTAAVQFHPESFLTIEGMTMLDNFLEGHI